MLRLSLFTTYSFMPMLACIYLPMMVCFQTDEVHCNPKSKPPEICPNGDKCTDSLTCTPDFCICPSNPADSKGKDKGNEPTEGQSARYQIRCDPNINNPKQFCPNHNACDSTVLQCPTMFCLCDKNSTGTSSQNFAESGQVRCTPNTIPKQMCPNGNACNPSFLKCHYLYCICDDSWKNQISFPVIMITKLRLEYPGPLIRSQMSSEEIKIKQVAVEDSGCPSNQVTISDWPVMLKNKHRSSNKLTIPPTIYDFTIEYQNLNVYESEEILIKGTSALIQKVAQVTGATVSLIMAPEILESVPKARETYIFLIIGISVAFGCVVVVIVFLIFRILKIHITDLITDIRKILTKNDAIELNLLVDRFDRTTQ